MSLGVGASSTCSCVGHWFPPWLHIQAPGGNGEFPNSWAVLQSKSNKIQVSGGNSVSSATEGGNLCARHH